LQAWLGRIDEADERAPIQISDPANKFPDFVRIAQLLARAGLHLGATTVGRILREVEPLPEDATATAPEVDVATLRVVTAKHPGHVLRGFLEAANFS